MIATANSNICKGLLRPLLSLSHTGVWRISSLVLQRGLAGNLVLSSRPVSSPNHGSPSSLVLSEDVEETKGPKISQDNRTGCMQEMVRGLF